MKNQNCIAIITARGGSKRIPNKNLIKINGLSLVGHTLKAAADAKLFSQIILSSDSDLILIEVKKIKNVIALKRNSKLASDTAKSMDVVLEILNHPDFKSAESVCLLQPTSPLRTAKHIRDCWNLFQSTGASAAVSAGPIVSNPFHMVYQQTQHGQHRVEPVLESNIFSFRTQDTPEIFALNGAIYFATVKKLKKDRSFIGKDALIYKMNLRDSLDIDEPTDLKLARKLLEKTGRKTGKSTNKRKVK